MTDATAPSALVSWAHRNADWDDAQAAAWEQIVHEFACLLRNNGVDADVDLWKLHSALVDWTRWGQNMVVECDFVIVVLSEAWKERWRGTNATNIGAGAVQEADALKGIFGKDQDEFQRKTLLVLMPGVEESVVPEDLYRLNRFRIDELSTGGVDDLLRTIFDNPRYIKPNLGEQPRPQPVPGTGQQADPPQLFATSPTTTFDAVGKDDYLARQLAVSRERMSRRRRGAGLSDEQLARITNYQPRIPVELVGLQPGQVRVLYGPLGSGKSEVAEQWLQSNLDAAVRRSDTAVPVWIGIDDLDTALETKVLTEVGLSTLERFGVDLVIDGLDERTNKAAGLIRQAGEFAKKWPKSRLLLTSRSTEGLDPGVLLEVTPLTAHDAQRLMDAVAGQHLGKFGPQIEATLSRPLFALLVAQQASSAVGATGVPELIDRVVTRVVSSEGFTLYGELRALAVETIRSGGPINPTRIATADVAAQLRASPLVSATGQGCSFALATFEQWFAARAVVEGVVDMDEILTSLESFNRWRYVLTIVLATADPTQADPVMDRLVRWNPGAASWVISETLSAGLTRAAPAMSPAQWESVGGRLRLAMAAWLDGLGPLAQAFWPLRAWGLATFDDVSLIVDISHNQLRLWWLARYEMSDKPMPLVLDKASLGSGLPNRRFKMVSIAIPTAVNGIWQVIRDYLATDLTQSFAPIALEVGQNHSGVVNDEHRVLEAATQALQYAPASTSTNQTAERLYPPADIAPSPRHPFGGYSTDQMHRYAVAVVEAALRCYTELASRVTPRFGRTLGLRGLMPIEFFADMHYQPDGEGSPYILNEPWFDWVLRPIGVEGDSADAAGGSRVALTVNDQQRSRQIRDDRTVLYAAYRRYVEANVVYEPFASSFSTHHGGIEVFDRLPATRIAIDWLWRDLKQLKFVDGHPPNRL